MEILVLKHTLPTKAQRLLPFLLCGACFLAGPGSALAAPPQEEAVAGPEPASKAPFDWFIIPLLGFSPDTSVAAATIGLVRFRFSGSPVTSRPSTLALFVTHTLKRQTLVQVGPQLYLDDERYFLRWETIFEDWPEPFFGVGPNTSNSDLEELNRRTLMVKTDFRRALVGKQLYVGLLQEASLNETRTGEGDGLLAERLVVGSEGGRLSGLGASFLYDSRDNDVLSRQGVFANLSAVFFREALGSEFDRDRYKLDVRAFADLWDQHVLAIQVIGEMNFGEVPFFDMAQLGGLNQLRGFLKGRFRDNHMLVGQAEYRSPYIWRLSFVGFGSIGQVMADPKDVRIENFKFAGGAGARFGVNPKEGINMRLDFGIAQDGSTGLYVGFIEAF